jgi:hypothetical protein
MATQHHVLSFPKAGRTWVRFLLGQYLRGAFRLGISDAECLELGRLTRGRPGWPHIQISHDRNCDTLPVSRLPRGVDEYRGKDVTLLVRDPRDVLVSWYFEKTRRHAVLWGHAADCPHDLPGFIRSEYGIALILRWMRDWAEQLDVPARVTVFKYEDLHADPLGTARALLAWLGVENLDEPALAQAVAAARFDAMRTLEASGNPNPRLQPGDPSDPESYKMRRGLVGGYRDYLGGEDLAYVEERMARADFGYAP